MPDVFNLLKDKDLLRPAKRVYWQASELPLKILNGKLIGTDERPLYFEYKISQKNIVIDFSKLHKQLKHKLPKWDWSKKNQFNELVKDIHHLPNNHPRYTNFEILFTPDKKANQQRLVVIFNRSKHPEINDGYLKLSTKTELAQLFFNLTEEGEPILDSSGNFTKALFIELAHRQSDGTRVILAQIKGPGITLPQPNQKSYELDLIFNPESINSQLIPLPALY